MSAYCKYALHLAPALIAAALTACEPYDFQDAPAVAGKVVSSLTNRPVVGAVVSMSAKKESERTQTDQNGRFSLSSLHHWGILTLTEGYLNIGKIGVLRVEALGYKSFTQSNIGDSPSNYENLIHGTSDGSHRNLEWEHIHVALDPN